MAKRVHTIERELQIKELYRQFRIEHPYDENNYANYYSTRKWVRNNIEENISIPAKVTLLWRILNPQSRQPPKKPTTFVAKKSIAFKWFSRDDIHHNNYQAYVHWLNTTEHIDQKVDKKTFIEYYRLFRKQRHNSAERSAHDGQVQDENLVEVVNQILSTEFSQSQTSTQVQNTQDTVVTASVENDDMEDDVVTVYSPTVDVDASSDNGPSTPGVDASICDTPKSCENTQDTLVTVEADNPPKDEVEGSGNMTFDIDDINNQQTDDMYIHPLIGQPYRDMERILIKMEMCDQHDEIIFRSPSLMHILKEMHKSEFSCVQIKGDGACFWVSVALACKKQTLKSEGVMAFKKEVLKLVTNVAEFVENIKVERNNAGDRPLKSERRIDAGEAQCPEALLSRYRNFIMDHTSFAFVSLYMYVEQYVQTTILVIDLSPTLPTPITLLAGMHDKYNPSLNERYFCFLLLSNPNTPGESHFDVLQKSRQGRFLFRDLSEEIRNLLVDENYSSKGVVDLFKMYN